MFVAIESGMQNLLFSIMGSFLMAVSAPTLSGIEPGRAAALSVPGMSTSTLDMARNLVRQKKPHEAIQDLEFYKPSQQERSSYHAVYARALAQLRNPYPSIEHYRLAYIYATADADREQLLLERAEIYAHMGYYSEAVVCLEVFLKTFTRSELIQQAELGIAVARYHLGEYREALAHYEKAGDSLPVRYGKANTLQSLGRTAEAHAIYRVLIGTDPQAVNSSPETLYNLGENYRQTGALDEAKIFLETVKEPLLKEKAAISLGLIAMAARDHKTAIDRFTAAAGSTDRNVQRQAIMYRADAFMQTGRLDEAEAALAEIRRSHPYGADYDTAALLLVRTYKAKGNTSGAISLLKELIYRRTPSRAALDELEAMLAGTRDRNELIKLWTGAGRWLMDPSRSSSLVTIAEGLRHTGRPFLDLCAWLVKIGSDDTKTQARLLLADFYADMGDAATAWGYLNRARVKGESDAVLRIKAKAYLVDKNQLNAAHAIMAIRDLRDKDLLLLLDIIRPLKNKDLEQALRFCFQTFAKKPAEPLIAVRFADVLYDAGRAKEARAYYQAVVADRRPGTPDASRTADKEWAQYRIAALTRGETSLQALQGLQSSKGSLGRLAAAELKVRALKEKVD
jgi:tetratricopeptide (TPR) repeat protein